MGLEAPDDAAVYSLGDGRLDLSQIVFEENHNIQMVNGPGGERLRAGA